MNSFKRPDASIKFGATGKPGSMQKQVKRDEVGELELNVIIADSGRTRINFNKPLTYLELQPDKAYDLAHLILEHVKDKQGGEPVNVTEEKILDALARTLRRNGLSEDEEDSRRTAAILLPEFMLGMAGEPETYVAGPEGVNEALKADDTTPIGEAQP